MNCMKYYSFLLVLVVGMAGCKVGQNYQGVEMSVPDQFYYEDTAHTVSPVAINADSLDLDVMFNLNWFSLFDDPMLDSLVRRALDYNQDVKIAAENVLQAQYAVTIQKANMLPFLGAGAGVQRRNFGVSQVNDADQLETTNLFYIAGTLNWELDFWGKFRRLNEAARAQLVASEQGFRSAQISLISTVANLYFQKLEFQTRIDISEQTLALRDSMMQIIQERFDKGIIPEIDLNQAQIQRAIAAGSIPLLKRSLAVTENQISVLTGTYPQDIRPGKLLLDQDTSISIPTGLPSELLVRRPDIIGAEYQLIAQNAVVGATQANRLPTISLSGTLGLASTQLSSLLSGQVINDLSGSLVAPLINWNQLKRAVDVEQSRRTQTELDYERTVLNAFREVEDALVSISTLKTELIARDQHVVAALRAQELSQERYDQGVTSYLEYLESQRQAFEAQQNFAGTKQQLLSSYAQLYKALGGGWVIE